MIAKLEQLRNTGVISSQDFSSMVDPSLYKDITQILFKVVSAFRHQVSSEKSKIEVKKTEEKKESKFFLAQKGAREPKGPPKGSEI